MKLLKRSQSQQNIKGLYRLLSWYKSYFVRKRSFLFFGKNSCINPPFNITPSNIYLGPETHIGCCCLISAVNAKFICKGHCAIAHHFTVHTGNHARIPGMFITDINDNNKPSGFDKDVIVEEDCWIGANVTLLSGVTIGRGTTVAAGSVVSKSLPPYSLCGGVPARFIKFYWNIEQILEHEEVLYSESDRYTRNELEYIYNQYN
jgi:acetyltransferase-like isoleucine patch superfamily enzyme